MERRQALLAWVRAHGRSSWLRSLEAEHGALESWWRDRVSVLRHAALGAKAVRRLSAGRWDEAAARDLEWVERFGWRVLESARTPRLAVLPEPPVVLFTSGALEFPGPGLAVVGARRASGYGLRTAEALVRDVASAGVAILSGLARGIDAAAHEAALSVGGLTLGVLGCGPDVVYPPEHADLQARIAEEGVLVTEHPPGSPPLAAHFPRRNRVLVALSDALLVVEARLRSGTLTSVRWAGDLGKDLLVVPGPVGAPLSEGPTQLMREGATPVGSPGHVLEALGVESASEGVSVGHELSARIGAAEGRVLALLAGEGLTLDELVRLSPDSPGRVLSLLLSLEVSGRVVRGDGLRYRCVGGGGLSAPSLPPGRPGDHPVHDEVQDHADADEADDP